MEDFENSKITKICYHGTSSEPFTILDKSKIQKNPEDGDSGYFGWGFYLTTNKDYAEQFGDTILKFKVNIQNPFDFTNINGKEIVDFIFDDCKNLSLRVSQTLRVINQIGRGLSWDFEVDNPEDLLSECRKLYNTYRDKEVDSSYIKDEKKVLIKLSQNIGNWLNGIFFYFGRELFHYFTKNGYDGIIALDGEEIVVYETEQLKPVLDEDIELDVVDYPDWRVGADEYTNKIINALKANPNISDIDLFGGKFYPLRQDCVWWESTPLLEFKYKDLLQIYFYCGGEVCIYRSEDDDYGMVTVSDLEEEGLFTDDMFYEYMRENEIWDSGWADNNSVYIGFVITPLKNNPNEDEYYSYDLGWDDGYKIDDYINDTLPQWVEEKLVPDFENSYPEYFEEETTVPETPIEEQVTKNKHVTKGQILSDVINKYGYISADNLTDAVYLLPNGKILNTVNTEGKAQHENIADYISKKYSIKDKDENDGSKIMSDLGAMRITPWIPAIFIPENVTESQEKTLYDILKKLSSEVSEDKPLMISTSDGSQQIEYTDISNPVEVINSILGYTLFRILKA